MRICLIVFQGAGKTTVGRWLSSQLKLPFFDTDQQIAITQSCSSVSQVFVKLGERRFREEECICVHSMLTVPSYVLSLGGGAIQALPILPRDVRVIYLFRPLKEIESEVVQAIPRWIDPIDPCSSFKERWAERNVVFFRFATGVILVEKRSVEDDGNKILQMVGIHGK